MTTAVSGSAIGARRSSPDDEQRRQWQQQQAHPTHQPSRTSLCSTQRLLSSTAFALRRAAAETPSSSQTPSSRPGRVAPQLPERCCWLAPGRPAPDDDNGGTTGAACRPCCSISCCWCRRSVLGRGREVLRTMAACLEVEAGRRRSGRLGPRELRAPAGAELCARARRLKGSSGEFPKRWDQLTTD